MQLSCKYVATCKKLASVRAAVQHRLPMAVDDCVVCTRPTQPKSCKILHSPANKDVLGVLEGYVAESADPTAVLPQSTWLCTACSRYLLKVSRLKDEVKKMEEIIRQQVLGICSRSGQLHITGSATTSFASRDDPTAVPRSVMTPAKRTADSHSGTETSSTPKRYRYSTTPVRRTLHRMQTPHGSSPAVTVSSKYNYLTNFCLFI